MDSIQNLLNRHRLPEEPSEVRAIKQYVRQEFDSEVSVSIRGTDIIVQAASASLVSMLRLRVVALQQACQTDKRLVFRVGKPSA